MEQWDFDAWLAALGALGPRRAALLGLAAAQRISGCLNDERFYRYGLIAPGEVEALLDGCWDMLAAGGAIGGGGGIAAGEDTEGAPAVAAPTVGASAQADAASTADAACPVPGLNKHEAISSARVGELARAVQRITKTSGDYVERSMTELFQSYGPLDDYGEFVRDEGGETACGDRDEALRDFVDEAEPQGAVAAHLDALNAVEYAAQACTGGPWDGALRCIQTTAMAGQFARGAAEGPDCEIFAQEEDLAALKAAQGEDLRAVAGQLRARARRDAASWHGFTVKLELFSD